MNGHKKHRQARWLQHGWAAHPRSQRWLPIRNRHPGGCRVTEGDFSAVVLLEPRIRAATYTSLPPGRQSGMDASASARSSVGRALPSEGKGRVFESRRACQYV
jgi:hypothetical protein